MVPLRSAPAASPRRRTTLPAAAALVVAVAAAAASPGCKALESIAAAPSSIVRRPAPERALTEEELAELLDKFAATFATTAQIAVEQVMRDSTDPVVQRAVLQWRIDAVRTCRDLVVGEDPQLAFVDCWVLCTRHRLYFGSPTSEHYGPHSEVLRSAMARLEDEIAKVGAAFLTPDELERCRTEVEKLAASSPMERGIARGTWIPSQSSPDTLRHLDWVVKLPMAPFQMFSGIDEGAAAVRHFSVVTERFTRRFEGLPQETLWQTQLLLMDLEQRPAVQRSLDGFESMAASADRIATTAQTFDATVRGLPEDLRRQVEAALADVEAQNAELRRTIEAAHAAIRDTGGVVTQVEGASAKLETTAANLRDAGAAWEAALRAYHTMVADLYPPEPADAAPPPGAAPEEPFEILDYAKTAAEIGAAARELRLAIEEAHGLLGDRGIEERIRTLEGAVADATTDARSKLEDVVDHAFVRALQLAAAVAALAVLVLRFGRRPRAAG